MHRRGSSPVFDAPEFPPLRRMKPLPKRRRTHDVVTQVSESDDLIQPTTDLLVGSGGGAPSLAEELIARADSLSSQMAMQSYYSSVFNGVGGGDITRGMGMGMGVGIGTGDQVLLDDEADGNPGFNLNLPGSTGVAQTFDLSAVYQRFADGLGSGKQDEDHSEGGYTDHLQQPGNTKKRKVPANMSGSVNGREVSLPLSPEEDIGDGGSFSMGNSRMDSDLDILVAPPFSVAQSQLSRKGKMSPSTLAGLQHKELLKHRKRQLAAVLGALSLGDALALDQALSTHLPFVSTMFGPDASPPKVRLSRRQGPRLARAAAAQASARKAASSRKVVSCPTTQFTFSYPSATSDRLIATKEEVLALRSRFEAELAHQAARAAKAAAEAKQAALVASRASRSKRSSKIQSSALANGDQFAEHSDLSASGKNRGNKKKKRNALAIASNPHHRNNYVPSRVASSGHVNPTQSTLNAQNSLGPLPLQFLSAELPPRRRRKEATAQIVNPAEEWICPRCEYLLFFGDSAEYRRAIRGRKQILRRRRRAQERAAGGLNASKNPVKAFSDDEESNGEDQSTAQSPAIAKSTTDWRDLKRAKGQLPFG